MGGIVTDSEQRTAKEATMLPHALHRADSPRRGHRGGQTRVRRRCPQGRQGMEHHRDPESHTGDDADLDAYVLDAHVWTVRVDAGTARDDRRRHVPSERVPLLNTGTPLSLIHISEPTRRTPISYAVFCL